MQCYHQVNGDDLDASKVSNSRCVRADAALSLRPIRHPFAAYFLAQRILHDLIVMDCGCNVGKKPQMMQNTRKEDGNVRNTEGKIRGKSGHIKRRDFLTFFRYFNNIKSNQSAITEVFEQYERNCVEFVVKWSSLHSISARIKKASKRVKIGRFYRIGLFFSIEIVRYSQIERYKCL